MKLKSISTGNSSRETRIIKLIKLTFFHNNQIKCFFDDNSSLIINGNYSKKSIKLDFITYFHSDNQVLNFSFKTPISYFNLREKLGEVVKIINRYSEEVYPFENFYEKKELILFCEKIKDHRWYYSEEFFSSSDEYYSLSSIDNLCVMKILKNLEVCICEYNHMIFESTLVNKYIRVQKVFPICTLPKCWNVPLNLIIHRYDLNLNKGK